MNYSLEEIENSEFIKKTFEFWFETNGHIRSPFPSYVIPMVKESAILQFQEWINKLPKKAEKEIDDTVVCEKFEEILFELGSHFVKTEDEKITLKYPFLPRIGDPINKSIEHNNSEVIFRKVLTEKDNKHLLIRAKEIETKQTWETKIELPI
ncbi:MAG: hypothetical protein KDE33_11695 [Bacteroidetes bacterium]|nr:hypothetical protein [Bacteroidota bacterium]MCB9226942.1 hypothetical protein [Chitinophagales bacterium]